MGGFAMDTTRAKQQFLPQSRTRLALTFDGLRYLREKELEFIADISKAQIEDKSKANGFAKLLVCFQAAWFCLQCITRVAQGLSLSLLELNTFAHAICMLLIYYMWWEKPLDIEEPTLTEGERTHLNLALMALMALNYHVEPPWTRVRNARSVRLQLIEPRLLEALTQNSHCDRLTRSNSW